MKVGLELRILGHPVALKIIDYLTKHLVLSAEELVAAMEKDKLPLQVITYHLLALDAQGLVKGEFEEESDGKIVKKYKVVPEKLKAVHKQLGSIVAQY